MPLTRNRPSRAACLAAGLAACLTTGAAAAQTTPAAVTRYPNPAGAVTAKAVEIAAPASLILVSGNTPPPADPAAAPNSAAYWGDTEAQTANTFKKIAAALAEMGLGLSDVVKVQAYLVGPAPGQSGDLAGFGRGYARHFGDAAVLPARTVVTVAALGRPGMLVEIEVTAARSRAGAPPRPAPPSAQP